jgi:hypothetical protein
MNLKFTAFCFIILLTAAGAYSQTYNVPEILYYKFNAGTTTTPNYAVPGRGFANAQILSQVIGPNGQFDSALVGTGGTGASTYTNTGWVMNIGTSSWTISFWINNYTTTSTCYLFGNDFNSSFRCFGKGAAGTTGVRLDGNGSTFAEIDLTNVLPGPGVVHFVYDSASAMLKGYVNGVFQRQVQQQPLNLTANVEFKVGSYYTNSGLPAGTLMDEFRFYSRALDSVEVANTWNHTLPHIVTGIQNTGSIAGTYSLKQNYPNPFNPATTINFTIPKAGNVKLAVYDMLGKEIQSIVNTNLNKGSYTATFDGSALSSGIYFYRLEAGEYIETKKMNLVK